MTTTSARLLQLLSLLQTRRDWPGSVLAERLGISHRTVRRDVERLREMGYRIAAAKGPDGGYRLDAGNELPPLLFDDDQVIALAVALQAATVTSTGVEEAAVRALATVRQLMPSRLRPRLDALSFTTLPVRPGQATPDPVSPDLLVALSAAVRAHEVVRFDYASPRAQDADDPVPPRRAEPHHLVTSEGRWYLVAWDLVHDDWRIFRADRIGLRIPNGPRFTPREVPGGDVTAFVSARFTGSDGRGGSGGSAGGGGWRCRGKAILSLPAAAVLPFAGDGVVEDLGPDRCALEVGSWSWVALAASLNRFGTDVEVVGPPELAAAFAQLSLRNAATAAAYAASPGGERRRADPAGHPA